MKHLMFAILISSPLILICQITEGPNLSSQGNQNSFSMDIPLMDNDVAENIWKKLAKDFKGKTKYNKKIGEFLTDDGSIKGLSNNSVDIMARIQGGKIILWFDLGGAYLNSGDHPERIFAAEDVMADYDYELRLELAEKEIEANEKLLKSFESDLDKLEKEKLNYQKLKDKALSEVSEQDRNLENNGESKKAQIEKISGQEKNIEGLKQVKNSIEKQSLKVASN